MFKILCGYLKNNDGATGLEYALFVAGIAMAIVFIVFDMGGALVEMLFTLANAIDVENAG